MKTETDEKGLTKVMKELGVGIDSLLGKGSEAWVLALDNDRVGRINRGGTTRAQVDGRTRLLAELGQSAGKVPFAIPAILHTLEIKGYIVTIEKRLPGRPMDQVLAVLKGKKREALVRAYLETAARIGDLTLERPWYGELAEDQAVRTKTFREYLEKRAGLSLKAAGPEFRGIDPAQLAGTLPEPDQAAFVHLDAFPGNILVAGGRVTAVLDFGTAAIMGDRRLEPLTAAVYLAPAMTPSATAQDRAVAREWLAGGCWGCYRRWKSGLPLTGRSPGTTSACISGVRRFCSTRRP